MRLNQLKPGARVTICGRGATLILVNESRARIRYDAEEVREFTTKDGEAVTIRRHRETDVSPTTEVD